MKSKRRIVLPAKCRDECYIFDIFYASSYYVLSMHFFTVEFLIKIRSRVNSPLVVWFNELRINDLGNNCFFVLKNFCIFYIKYDRYILSAFSRKQLLTIENLKFMIILFRCTFEFLIVYLVRGFNRKWIALL